MSDLSVTREAPSYDRSALRPRLLHLGFGAFARAHPMWFLDRGLDAVGGDWGVIAARMHSGVDELDALGSAEGGYHIVAADGEAATLRRIGCVLGTRHPGRDGADALPDLIASDDLAVILLTVTEKGYCQSDGHLDTDRADVAADLEGAAPRTAIGLLAEGLARRRRAGAGPLTILSCDNIPGNGDLLRSVLDEYARRRDPGLAEWIAASVAFPSSMVDRITPAMNEEGRALVREVLGEDDPNSIVTEPFCQWVIEDRFAGARPPFAEGGAELVADVTPFEEMKLRMLNGAHTFLAHAGRLAGHETVAETMAEPVLREAALRLMTREQAATLDMPDGVDLEAYAQALIGRFGNIRLRHRLTQIASDTSQKMPQRLFAPLRANLDAGREAPLAALATASWIAALRDLDPIPDPRQDELRRAAADEAPVRAVLTLSGLCRDPDALIAPVAAAFEAISTHGIIPALKEAT